MGACVYVGGYGGTISLYALDEGSGALALRERTPAGSAPSYLDISPDRRHLYAINEAEGAESVVLAFSIDAANGGRLRAVGSAPSGGDGSPHLAVHPCGRWLAAAHYLSGHTSILPIDPGGRLAAPSAIVRGPDDDSRKAHQAVFDAAGAHLLVPCLESNYVLQLCFRAGELTYNDPPFVAVPGGPRHLALAPGERHAYVLSELSSELSWFAYDAPSGRLTKLGTLAGHCKTAGAGGHIEVHPSGRFLYLSQRDENSIGLFALDPTGRPERRSFFHERIDSPRDFTLDPSGRFLFVVNQEGAEDLLVFTIEQQTGTLQLAHSVPVGGQPSVVRVLELP